MIFRQLFEEISSTYTYLIGSEETGEALLIDPVLPTWQRDLDVIKKLQLNLVMTVETHIHADHITSAKLLKRETGSKIAGPAMDELPCTDLGLIDGEAFGIADLTLQALHTPGHTDNHMAYLFEGRVLTGDALLIDGCGRTDFQNGNARDLYNSITSKIFSLPDETLVYPAHDYKSRFVSSVAQEKARNPRVGQGKSLDDFVQIMNELGLPYPKFIDYAVPGNRNCGECPSNIPDHLKEYCGHMGESLQG